MMSRHMTLRSGLIFAVLSGLGGAAQGQALINLPAQKPVVAGHQDAGEYAPETPPEASVPGALEAPPLVARGLNESDAQYTARMTEIQQQLKARDAAAQTRLAQLLKQVTTNVGGSATPKLSLPDLPEVNLGNGWVPPAPATPAPRPTQQQQ